MDLRDIGELDGCMVLHEEADISLVDDDCSDELNEFEINVLSDAFPAKLSLEKSYFIAVDDVTWGYLTSLRFSVLDWEETDDSIDCARGGEQLDRELCEY